MSTSSSKKKKKPAPNKASGFLKTLKLYFSSLTARGAKYLYLNVADDPNTMVVSNGDYELLTAYVPVTLSIHVITFKNTEFFEEFLQFMNIPKGCPYIVRIPVVLAALKNNSKEEVHALKAEDGKLHLALRDQIVEDDLDDYDDELEDDEDDESPASEFDIFADKSKYVVKTFDDAKVCGKPIDNFHARVILEETVAKMLEYRNTFGKTDCPCACKPVDRESITYFTSNYFRMEIPLSEFVTENGERYYPEDMYDFHVILIDGLDVPSIKEFMKRKDGELTLLLWSKSGGAIQHMATYEDEDVSICSMRPFLEVIPLKRKIINTPE